MCGRIVWRAVASILFLGGGTCAVAQIPDTTAVADSVAVPDSLAIPDTVSAADTVRTTTPSDSLTSPTASPSGVPITPIPAFTDVLSAEELFGFSRNAGAIAFPLSTPGHWTGTHIEGVPLGSMSLTLDDLPVYDLITGDVIPALIPAEITDQFHHTGVETGSAVGLATATRPLRSLHPITELRFLVGSSGAQAVSATHAQTRRAPGFLGGADGRVTGTFHVANRRGDGIREQPLRHTDLVGRLGLLRPSLGVESQFQYAERTETVHLVDTPAFVPRRTLRTDLRFSVATPVLGERPTRLTARWTRQSLRLGGIDTVATHQGAVRLVQPAGSRRTVDGWVVWDGAYEGDSLASPARTSFGVTVSDTLRFFGNKLSAALGVANRDESWHPVLFGRFERSDLFVEASYGSAMPSRLVDSLTVEQVARGAVGGSFEWGALRVGLGATVSRRADGYARVYGPDSLFHLMHLEEPMTRVGATAEVGLRDRHERGLYTTAWGAVTQPVGVEGELAGHVAETLPGFRGSLRVGFRAVREDTPRITLDLSATLSGWTSFNTQVVDPVSGEPAVHFREDSPIPRTLPADGMLDLLAEAVISNRAHVFLGLNHALGSMNPVSFLGDEPLPERQIRFGISWVLTD